MNQLTNSHKLLILMIMVGGTTYLCLRYKSQFTIAMDYTMNPTRTADSHLTVDLRVSEKNSKATTSLQKTRPTTTKPKTETSRTVTPNSTKTTPREIKKSKTVEDDIKRWLQDVLKLHQKFHPKTLESCKNVCKFDKSVCKAKQYEHWEKLLSSKRKELKPVRLFSDKESIFPWEKEYLSHSRLKDVKLLPDLKLSRVYFSNSKSGSSKDLRNVRCKKDDWLTFRVDLVDGYRNARKLGGDEVRAWISDINGTRHMTGSVRDEGNGTYMVTVTPSWIGKVKLNVAVVYPREYLRAALYHMKEGRHRFIFGQFTKKAINATEVTICHTTPNIPGRPCLCNFTEWNKRPYYCGRPLDTRLSCKDWVAIKSASTPTAKDYTKAEAVMATKMSRLPDAATIKHSIVITAKKNDKPADPLPWCAHLKNRTLTWTQESPRGIWTNTGKRWNSLVCREPPLTSSWVTACLNSTSVWMIGDSNLDQLDAQLRRYVSFKYVPKRRAIWSQERRGFNATFNITNTFRGHEYPLFHYIARSWYTLLNQAGVEDFFSKIPSTGNHVVIIHYNLHFAISHLSAFLQRLLAVRRAVRDLLARNPSTLVAIRGPHISAVEWQRNHLFGGDVQGKFILRLIGDVFEDLKEKIVFIDGWDMTISFRNQKMHPPAVVPNAMLRTLLAFKCDNDLSSESLGRS